MNAASYGADALPRPCGEQVAEGGTVDQPLRPGLARLGNRDVADRVHALGKPGREPVESLRDHHGGCSGIPSDCAPATHTIWVETLGFSTAELQGMARVQRLGLTVAMAVVAVNVPTGSPVAALWIGSQLQGNGPPKMSSVAAVVVALAAFSLGLIRLLALLGGCHDRLAGVTPQVQSHLPWLRSMRGERAVYPGEQAQITRLEGILVATVVLAIIAFEIWLLFYSGSPFDQRTGRAGGR